MSSVVFPISREAACCGVYVYLEANRVGLRSREGIRREYIRSYEDAYIKSFEKRKSCIMQKKTGEIKVPSLESISYTDIYNDSGYKLFSRWSKPADPIYICVDDNYEFGALDSGYSGINSEELDMVSSGTEIFSVPITVGSVVEDSEESFGSERSSVEVSDFEWVESGTELFSIICEKPVAKENYPVSVDSGSSVEEVSGSDHEEQTSGRDIWGEPITESVSQGIEEAQPIIKEEYQETDSERNQITFVSPPVVGEPKEPPKRVSAVKGVSSSPSRLDENSIRDFIKGHKLCSEVDILKHFSDHDPIKVRGVIKSAARHYKIFEKHGKFTV